MNTIIKFFCLILLSSSSIKSMHSEKKVYQSDNSIDSKLDVICDPCLYPFIGCCLGAYNTSSQLYHRIFTGKQTPVIPNFKEKKD